MGAAKALADRIAGGDADWGDFAGLLDEAERMPSACKADVSARHRKEWEVSRKILARALASGDESKVKFAKLVADFYKVAQEGERRAWGFADGEASREMSLAWEE